MSNKPYVTMPPAELKARSAMATTQTLRDARVAFTSSRRSVWLWDDGVGKKPGFFLTSYVIQNPKIYLDWAKKWGINSTWLDPTNIFGNAALISKLKDFLVASAEQGMTTQFLFGNDPDLLYKTWLLTAQVDNLLVLLLELKKLKLDVKLWPLALQIDLEPHRNSDFYFPKKNVIDPKVENPNAVYAYLVTLVVIKLKLQAFNKSQGTNIGLVSAVAFWYIKTEPTSAEVPMWAGQDFGKEIMKLGVDVAVMNYRNSLESAMISATPWVALAASLGRTAAIGFETKDLTVPDPHLLAVPDPQAVQVSEEAFISYSWGERKKLLKSDLLAMSSKFYGQLGFGGVAVHDAEWFATFPV